MDKEVFDTTRRGFLKTLAIGAGGCALGSGMLLPGNALAESLTGNLAKVPVETRWAISSGGLVKNQLFNFKNLLDGVGREKFIEIISKKSFFVGGRARRWPKSLDLLETMRNPVRRQLRRWCQFFTALRNNSHLKR